SRANAHPRSVFCARPSRSTRSISPRIAVSPPPSRSRATATPRSWSTSATCAPRSIRATGSARGSRRPTPWSSCETSPGRATSGSAVVEADAARYLGTHDPRAADSALEAARRYIKDGRNDAASDLLLQLIASGVADHDAQRLLVDVVRLLPGKRDVVKQKCKLLVQALLLDGRNDLAAEVAALVEE